jgi:hypothetical protein
MVIKYEKIKNSNEIKSYYKNRLLFIKYLRDNPGTDIPVPDDKVFGTYKVTKL